MVPNWKLPRSFNIDQMPKVFHEQGIIFGYRPPQSSATDCLLSVFQLTNETLNIWTHFLPAWYFLWKLLSTWCRLDFWNDPYSWPLLVYMVTSCVYPFASSCAHTFSSMSLRARHICYFFDYGAVNLFGLGSAVAYSAYAFPDSWVRSAFHRCYVPLALFNSVVSVGLACYSRFLEVERPRLSKALRTLAFAYPYTWDSLPVFYRLLVSSGESARDAANDFHLKHTAVAFLTCFLYASHLPERLAPGRFDYIGHSHQLFHVCGIVGTHIQMEALFLDMTLRKEWLLASSIPPSFAHTVGALGLCFLLGVINIGFFSRKVLYRPPKSQGKELKAKQ
ncbi:membrane progestin receptor gamma [Tachyglossus aculeatus]|uniref:membrane progestin receptor gamma n=1 Tax=Tachyglossus aculeatus TaxID=9261 RepID=UPI0018F6F79A|nr:membrane progestin receptor gamma [Tachyglossus aculeatus]XP_038622983.1 membrane progestin receptor gamma [Tachyglossus aculeatus]